MKKLMIFLGLIVLLGMIAGCEKKGSAKEGDIAEETTAGGREFNSDEQMALMGQEIRESIARSYNKPSPKPVSKDSVPGDYVEKFKRKWILIINRDGTFKYDGDGSLKGEWELNGNKLTFYCQLTYGKVEAMGLSGEMDGNVLHCDGGSTFVKK